MNMLLFWPMFVYVIHIAALGAINFLTRKNAVVTKQVKMSYMRVYSGEAPERLVAVARHFDNQFQVPMLFLITCMATNMFIGADIFAVTLAWGFVLTRFAHSYIHLTSNNVLQRALIFFTGFLMVVLMWLSMAYRIAFPPIT